MGYYPEPDNYIRDKVKLILDLSNYTSRKELELVTGISNLAAKKDCCFESWSWQTRH